MLETITSDLLDGVMGGQQTQNNGSQNCQGVSGNSCTNVQRDERNYGNQINPVTNVSALPANEAT